MAREQIPGASADAQRLLFGPLDENLRRLRDVYGVRIVARNEVLTLEGEDQDMVRDVAGRIRRVLTRLRASPKESELEDVTGVLFGEAATRRSSRPARSDAAPGGGPVRGRSSSPGPITPTQRRYVEAISRSDVVFAIGPAGTGKTFLAVVEAVQALREGRRRRIVLTRPAVEAGEKLGFLPGDFQAKINPYLRPLYDALGEMLAYGEVQRYIDADVIEICPLAYMRGRTLKNAFIILDEAQNTTRIQMKMFLTRLGEGSNVVVTGDVTQIDLPDQTVSGLVESARILQGVRGISVLRFGTEDIVRHPLVQQIVDAYAADDARRRNGPAPEDDA